MGKSKAKKQKLAKKKELLEDDNIRTVQSPALPKPKAEKQKLQKSSKTGITIPLFLFSFLTLLLGIGIVLVSEHLQPTKPLTQPLQFKIIPNRNIQNAKTQVNENEQSENLKDSMQNTAAQEADTSIGIQEHLQAADSVTKKLNDDAMPTTEKPDKHAINQLFIKPEALDSSKEMSSNPPLENILGDTTETPKKQRQTKQLEKGMTDEDDPANDEADAETMQQSQMAFQTQSHLTEDITPMEKNMKNEIYQRKSENEDNSATLKEEIIDDFDQTRKTTHDKFHLEETEEKEETATATTLVTLSANQQNEDHAAKTHAEEKNVIFGQQDDLGLKEDELVMKIKDEALDEFANLKDGLFEVPPSEVQDDVPVAQQENEISSNTITKPDADKNEKEETFSSDTQEATNSAEDEVLYETYLQADDIADEHERLNEATESDDGIMDDQGNQQMKTGSLEQKPKDELQNNMPQKNFSENYEAKDEEEPVKSNIDLSKATTKTNSEDDTEDSVTKKENTNYDDQADNTENQNDSEPLSPQMQDADKHNDESFKPQNITKNTTESDHEAQSNKTSNVTSNITTDASFTITEVTFPKKSNNKDTEYFDIINEEMDNYDEEQHDEDEIDGDVFETEPTDQTYHVEEKRIKIIKDSQYVPITDGVRKHIIREGYGTVPKMGDQVTLQCVGYIDKTPPKMFWNTKELGQRPFKFVVGEKQVIKGWDEAVSSMRLLEKSKFKIEAKKAYGKFGFGAWECKPDYGIRVDGHKKIFYEVKKISSV